MSRRSRTWWSKKTGTQIIRLSNVANIEDGFEDETSRAHMVWRDLTDHKPYEESVQAMGILKAPGSNAVSVAANVRKALDDIQKTLPDNIHLNVLFDTTGFIKESVSEIGLELVLAVILTAIVCWLFLGSLSSTLNVLFAIPMSLLGTIAVLYFLHWTLNTFTLLGLSLAVGLVVDDAVMVMENIYRHAEMGKTKLEAARDGTKEITFAALAATIAVIAIFLPVAFMSGVIGKYFLQFGVTLSVAVAISYVEAITLAPARCAQMLVVVPHDQKGLVARIGDRSFAALERVYSRVLAVALRVPLLVLLIAAGVLFGAYFAFSQLQREMVPSQDQSRLAVRLTMPTGSDLDTSDRLTHTAEALLMQHPELDHVQTTVNVGGASLSLTMVPANERKITQLAFMAIIRKELSTIPGVRGSVQDLSQQGFGGGRGKPVEISVRGGDWNKLIDLSIKVQKELEDSGLASDLESDYTLGPPELAVSPDRAAATDVGVNVTDIATTVSALIGGSTIGQFSAAGRRMNIEMRMEATHRTRPEDLDLMRVRSTAGTMVPLAAVTTTAEIPELQSINHANRQRAIRLQGNVGPGHAQSEVLAYVQNTLQKEAPPGFTLVLSGQSSQFGDAMSSLGFALIVGIIFAYMVLASQFNSILHPITVLTILPLSLAGAMVALWITGKTLNVYSMIGLLLLMGIVKKNSIILVDYANEVREKERLTAVDAMKKAGPVRLRPILMTAVATMMAAVPSALGLGPGAETRGPMADAIIGGLILSTVLSLFVVPAFYVVADRVTRRFKKAPPVATVVPAGAHGNVVEPVAEGPGAGPADEATSVGEPPAPQPPEH